MSSNIKVATPEEFVKRFGGTRVINKVLIANNGISGKKLWKKGVDTSHLKKIISSIM